MTVEANGKGKGDDPTSAGTELQNLGHKRGAVDEAEELKSKELENMVTKEVDEWRSAVDRSQTGLRHRVNHVGTSGSALEEVSLDIMKLFEYLLKCQSNFLVEYIPPVRSNFSDTPNIRLLK